MFKYNTLPMQLAYLFFFIIIFVVVVVVVVVAAVSVQSQIGPQQV